MINTVNSIENDMEPSNEIKYALLHADKVEVRRNTYEQIQSNPLDFDLSTRAWFMAIIYDDIRDNNGFDDFEDSTKATEVFHMLCKLGDEPELLELFVHHLDTIESLGYYTGQNPSIKDDIINIINSCPSFEFPLIQSLVKQKLVIDSPELIGKLAKCLNRKEDINSYFYDLLDSNAFGEQWVGTKSITALVEQLGSEPMIEAIERAINYVDTLGNYNSQYDAIRINAFINILKVLGEDVFTTEKIASRLHDKNNLLVEFFSSAIIMQKELNYPKITTLYLDNIDLFLRRLGTSNLEAEHLIFAKALGRDEEMCKKIAEAVEGDPFSGTASYALIASTLGLDALVKCAPDLSAKKAMGIYYNAFEEDGKVTPRMFAKAYPNCKHQLLSNDFGL